MMGRRSHGVSDKETGEARERARRSRRTIIFGGVFAVGIVTGFLIGVNEADNLFSGAGSEGWSPAMAIGIAISFLASVIGGGIALARQTDEVERLAQYRAVAAAALAYMLAYPVWFALWMGNLAPEPMHAVLFGLFWFVTMAAFLFYRFR